MRNTLFPGTYATPKYLSGGKRKACKKCGEELPIANFPRDAKVKSGTRGTCRACLAKYRSERRRAGSS